MSVHALLAGLTTVDVIHAVDHVPDPNIKVTSTAHVMAAGGPATNAAVALAALESIATTLGAGAGTQGGLGSTDGGGFGSDEGGAVTLLTAVGRGVTSDLVRADLDAAGVTLIDATALPAGEIGDLPPALSSILEHPGGRMVASTNARLQVDVDTAAADLERALAAHGEPQVVLVDGHNPALAECVLLVGVTHPDAVGPRPGDGGGAGGQAGTEASDEDGPCPDLASGDPFAMLEAKPAHLRVLDGGSWKPWFVPLLGLVDVAVVSADFCPPLLDFPTGPAVADFLRGFGITRTVRTRGDRAVEWFWGAGSGTVQVPGVEAVSTLGAGDIFHGAFCWALATLPDRGRDLQDPSAVIAFASRVAAASTTSFGTRAWREDPLVRDTVSDWLGHLGS
ncbi:kinase [Schaalia sp. 19OD2882]|uniref:PfkB family carbohydrate kinase n=1 Tax=Schaalia sp. 19OD2882 TaxID=2794089 RepID=UPI001C1F181F|nr:PfkB family carbohydrate kinase [Schaalia sp. 19OD2882]QWW19690.1 kinase [Schaalia sp. 19OD2882]